MFVVVGDSRLSRLVDTLWHWTVILCLPLFAVDLYLKSDLPPELHLLHLVFPAYHLLMTQILNRSVDYKLTDLSRALCITSVIYSSFSASAVFGYILALIYVIIYFGNYIHTEAFSLLVAAGNVAAVFALQGKDLSAG